MKRLAIIHTAVGFPLIKGVKKSQNVPILYIYDVFEFNKEKGTFDVVEFNRSVHTYGVLTADWNKFTKSYIPLNFEYDAGTKIKLKTTKVNKLEVDNINYLEQELNAHKYTLQNIVIDKVEEGYLLYNVGSKTFRTIKKIPENLSLCSATIALKDGLSFLKPIGYSLKDLQVYKEKQNKEKVKPMVGNNEKEKGVKKDIPQKEQEVIIVSDLGNQIVEELDDLIEREIDYPAGLDGFLVRLAAEYPLEYKRLYSNEKYKSLLKKNDYLKLKIVNAKENEFEIALKLHHMGYNNRVKLYDALARFYKMHKISGWGKYFMNILVPTSEEYKELAYTVCGDADLYEEHMEYEKEAYPNGDIAAFLKQWEDC